MFELLSWLAYAIWGFLFLTFYVFLMVGRSILESGDGLAFLHFLPIEFLATMNILLFCLSLRWCVGGGPGDRRIGQLKTSAFLLSIMLIMIGGCVLLGVGDDLYEWEFLVSFVLAMIPLILAMGCSFVRARSQDSAIEDKVNPRALKIERVYITTVFSLLFVGWNLLCFL